VKQTLKITSAVIATAYMCFGIAMFTKLDGVLAPIGVFILYTLFPLLIGAFVGYAYSDVIKEDIH